MAATGPGFFDARYAAMLARDKPPAVTRAEVDLVERLLALPGRSRLLDLGCGHGRHAAELARRGHEVLGLDFSTAMIAEARRRHGGRPRLRFLRGDLAAIEFRQEFDAAIAMFNPLGCLPAGRLRGALRRIARALRPGGRLLIDERDPAWDAVHLAPRDWWRSPDGGWVLQTASFDRRARVARFRWLVVEPGRVETERREAQLQEYPLSGWRRMLYAAGLRLIGSRGDYRRRTAAGAGPRLILVAERGR